MLRNQLYQEPKKYYISTLTFDYILLSINSIIYELRYSNIIMVLIDLNSKLLGGLAQRQVPSVAYGPLVRDKENSVDKLKELNTIISSITNHIPMRHLHYEYNHDTHMMGRPHNKQDNQQMNQYIEHCPTKLAENLIHYCIIQYR